MRYTAYSSKDSVSHTAWIKERIVRRIVCAVLISALTIAVPLSSPAGAVIVNKPHKLAIPHRPAAVNPVRRALVADAHAVRTSIPRLRAEWQRVAICEVGGDWFMTGPTYSGIGFSNATWYQYGGRHFAPLAGEATKDQQILIGMRVTKSWVPDQHGCSPTGW